MAADEQRRTDSGIPVRPFYSDADGADRPDPGSYPYTRGVRRDPDPWSRSFERRREAIMGS